MLKIRGLSGASGFVLGLVVATAIAYAGPLQLLADEGGGTVVEDVEVDDDLVGDEECPTDAGDGTTDAGDGTTDAGVGTTDDGDGTTDAGDGTTDEAVEDPCAEAGIDEEEEVATGADLEGDVVEDGPEADVLGDNHGKVVSTAAHCPIKGRAHGELVSEIARDKDATVADAEEACEEALAEVEASTEASDAVGSNDDVSSHGGPPPWAGPKDKAEKSSGGPPWAGPKR